MWVACCAWVFPVLLCLVSSCVVLDRFFPRFFFGIVFCGFLWKLWLSVMTRPDRGLQHIVRLFWFEMRKKQLVKHECVVGKEFFWLSSSRKFAKNLEFVWRRERVRGVLSVTISRCGNVRKRTQNHAEERREARRVGDTEKMKKGKNVERRKDKRRNKTERQGRNFTNEESLMHHEPWTMNHEPRTVNSSILLL